MFSPWQYRSCGRPSCKSFLGCVIGLLVNNWHHLSFCSCISYWTVLSACYLLCFCNFCSFAFENNLGTLWLQVLILKSQFWMSPLLHFLGIQLPKVLKTLYDVSVFKFPVSRDWNLGAMPIHSILLWLHLLWFQIDYITKSRFVSIGKFIAWMYWTKLYLFSVVGPSLLVGILGMCAYTCTHISSSYFWWSPSRFLFLIYNVCAGIILLDGVSVKRMNGKVYRRGSGVLLCHLMKLDTSMWGLTVKYRVQWQLLLKKVCFFMS